MDNSFGENSAKRQLESADQRGSESQAKRSKNNQGGRAPGHMVVFVVLKNTKAKGAVIGKRGSTITDIRARCNVAFSISKEESPEQIGQITGDPWGIARALSMCAEELSIAFDEGPKSIMILVEEKNLGCLLGEGGSRVKEIQDRTRCKIYTSPNTIGPSSQNLVEVVGENFDDAITAVIEALVEGTEPISMPFTPGQGGDNAIDDAWGDINRELEKRGPRPRNRLTNELREGGVRTYGQEQWGDERPWIGDRSRSQFSLDGHRGGWGVGRGYNRSRAGVQGFSSFINRSPNEGRQEARPLSGRWAGSRQDSEAPAPEIAKHQGPGFREERTIFVPTDMISEVIGKRGANVKLIRERTGAKICIEKGREEDFSELKLIVSGDTENIAQAASMIHEFAP